MTEFEAEAGNPQRLYCITCGYDGRNMTLFAGVPYCDDHSPQRVFVIQPEKDPYDEAEVRRSHLSQIETENQALRAAYEHLMLTAICNWHDTDFYEYNGVPICSWLEISEEEYAKWVEDPQHIIEVPDADPSL